jgi:predicted kinase
MSNSFPNVLLITGAMAAGKSTIAQALAERLERSVHLRGDMFRRMIVSGRVSPTPDMPEEATAQLLLRYELAAMVARRYVASGYTVIFQDVILGAVLSSVCGLFEDEDLGVVVLRPSVQTLAQREADRAKSGYRGFSPADLDAVLERETPRLGLWLDTSDQSVEETVHAIFERLSETRRKFEPRQSH